MDIDNEKNTGDQATGADEASTSVAPPVTTIEAFELPEGVVRRKRQGRTVPSDDYIIFENGEKIAPHAGEWVRVRGGVAVGHMQSLWRLQALSVTVDAAKGEVDEIARVNTAVAGHFDDINVALAAHIMDWNWTNDREELLPKPDAPNVFEKWCEPTEVMYLIGLIVGEAPEAEKNG